MTPDLDIRPAVPARVAEATGPRIHLVPGERVGLDGVRGWIALCGSKPALFSAGWSALPGMVSNCGRCLQREAARQRIIQSTPSVTENTPTTAKT